MIGRHLGLGLARARRRCWLDARASKPSRFPPTAARTSFDPAALADDGLRAFLATNGVVGAWPRESWDLPALSLAAFYYHPDMDLARARWHSATAGKHHRRPATESEPGVHPAHQFLVHRQRRDAVDPRRRARHPGRDHGQAQVSRGAGRAPRTRWRGSISRARPGWSAAGCGPACSRCRALRKPPPCCANRARRWAAWRAWWNSNGKRAPFRPWKSRRRGWRTRTRCSVSRMPNARRRTRAANWPRPSVCRCRRSTA